MHHNQIYAMSDNLTVNDVCLINNKEQKFMLNIDSKCSLTHDETVFIISELEKDKTT